MALVDQTQETEGVFVTLADLITLRFAAKKLHLTNRSRALNSLAGPNQVYPQQLLFVQQLQEHYSYT